MKVIKIDELTLVPNPHNVEARKVFENAYLEVMHLTLKPGEHLTKHQLSVNVFFFITDGNGIIETGDEKQEVSKNYLIEGPANILRSWTNAGNEPLRILVVKSPVPTPDEKREAIREIKKEQLSKE